MNDELLAAYLRATEEKDAERLLATLIGDHLAAVLRQVIGYRLRSFGGGASSPSSQDTEDVCSEALVQLLTRLKGLKAGPASDPITNLPGYAAMIAHNACHEYLRRRYPRRWSLKNRLRYFLTHRKGFALWKTENGNLVCGTADWRVASKKPAGYSRLHILNHRLRETDAADWRNPDLLPGRLADLLNFIFREVGDPIDLDDLIAVLADWWGITEASAVPDAGREDGVYHNVEADPRIGADLRVERRGFLENLWGEIRQLPPRQRVALLLGLRDEKGNGIVELFFMMGISAIREIAAVLEMPVQDLAGMWNALPLEDSAIGARLGATRQQVINLRKSARERLARRMKMRPG